MTVRGYPMPDISLFGLILLWLCWIGLFDSRYFLRSFRTKAASFIYYILLLSAPDEGSLLQTSRNPPSFCLC
jgi:hypothetical protein